MIPERRKLGRNAPERSRSALLWLLVWFTLFQLAFDVAMERWQPVVRDPEYCCKLDRLRAQLLAGPDRPLVLVLGSSRTNLGVCPAVMAPHRTALSTPPLVFNFSINGAGPRMQLVTLRRLLADGIHPNRIVLEILPPALHQDETYNEEMWVNINRLGLDDVRTLLRYSEHRLLLARHWLRSRMTPCTSHRHWFMLHYAHSWIHLDPERPQDWSNIDSLGWERYYRQQVDRAEYARGLQAAHDEYAYVLNHFRIGAAPDRVLRDLLGLCRRERIGVTLLLMPEGSTFRSWYRPGAPAEIGTYVDGLCKEFGIVAVDAHTWMPDDAYFDGHHLLPDGAIRFSTQLLPHLFPTLRETAHLSRMAADSDGLCRPVASPCSLR